jgi:4-carboxymuconolactone decarboxylase
MARLRGAGGTGAVADLIRQRRGGDLRPIDELLLLSPPLAEGWNALLGAIRGQLELDSSLRELVILRIAVLNGADYEWQAHEPVARRCGFTDAKLAALRDESGGTALDPLERAVLAYTDAMTRDVTVPAGLFAGLAERLSPRELAELTATAAAYNMVSRFVVALEVDVPAGGRP